jgi:glutamate carboxypeptidase
MHTHFAQLDWIDSQSDRMVSLVTEWCEINSGSRNLTGLAAMSSRLQADFSGLGGVMREIALRPEITIDNSGESIVTPLGKAISIRKRPGAPVQVFLGIHMDTVYGLDHPLQHVRRVDDLTINGPGVADAKGGLCVMLVALEALERSEFADRLGWEILINPDEELGSPGSAELLKECAARNHLGLVFEPAHADGALVGERKGSGNFTVVIHGRSAHAGRDYHHGRNAIHSAAELVVALEAINRTHPGVTVNVGRIDGGGPTNIVPDLAIVRFNARVPAHQNPQAVLGEIQRAIDAVARRDGIRLEMTGGFNSPPRPMDAVTSSLYEQLAACGAELGLNLAWHSSGGVSDANKLSAAGLPVIDTLGPAGGNLHSAEEFMLTNTLIQKAKLSALLLSRLATGEIPLPRVIGP